MYTIGIVTYLKSLPKITSNFNVAFFQKDNQKIVLTFVFVILLTSLLVATVFRTYIFWVLYFPERSYPGSGSISLL